MADERPDPDRLLAALRREAEQPPGKLKVFLGAAAGVGKTVAMLEAAREALDAGREVLIGVVETHGRAETQARLEGVLAVPLRASERPGVPAELDLDAVLACQPEVVIIDELAHTNAPGSRHTKRWQDVIELVGHGIEVWTAMNIQHLESLNDVVARLTGVDVHETVPDHVLDRAAEIEIVDLTPEDLVARLEAGKVYAPDQARRALGGFFKLGNLIALRQLALRRAAMRVGEQLDTLRDRDANPKVWAAAERLLVAVGPSPLSGRLVRVASRMARSLDVPWHAVTIRLVRPSSPRSTQLALEHLRLAEQLGAETASLTSDDVPGALVEYARRINATMLVLGAPTRRTWREWASGTLLDHVIQRATDIEVHVVAAEAAVGSPPKRDAPSAAEPTSWELPRAKDVGVAALTAAVATGAAALVRPFVSESDIIMLYVAAVTVAAFRVRLVAGLTSALLSALAFNFFFTEPRFTLYVHDSRYWLTFLMIGGVGGLVSTLAARLREHAAAVREREAQSQELFLLTRQLAGCRSITEVAEVSVEQVHRLFGLPVSVLLPSEDGLALAAQRGVMSNDDVERVTARWAAEHGVPAGAGTGTLSGATGRYLPLGLEGRNRGVVAIRPTPASRLADPDRGHLLDTVVTLIREFLERLDLESRAEASRLQVETERIRSTLLSSVSHDLRTPLATITGAATTLLDKQALLRDETREALLTRIASEALRLQRLLENVLNMTRLDGGTLQPSLDWEIPDEIVASAIARTTPLAHGRVIRPRWVHPPVLARLDAVLVEQLVANFIENALIHAPGDSPVEVTTYESAGDVVIEVADRGPSELGPSPERLFEKFVRGSTSSGAGLGLAICKAIAQVHGGRVWAHPREGGGAVFGAAFPRGGPLREQAPAFEDVLDHTEES